MSTVQAQRDELLTAALDYAARGWPVLALRPKGKTPLLAHGLHDASTDPVVVRSWWVRWPYANVGLRSGVCFDVLDVDGPDGLDALGDHIPADGEPLTGPTVVTGHGWHTYVAPTGQGNRAGLVDHVDWRGVAGYVVAPPSVHPSGQLYRWAFGDQGPIRPAPAWLLELLEPPKREEATVPTLRRSTARDLYGRRALEDELGRLAGAAVGTRNHTLYVAAVRLGQLVADGHLDANEVAARLADQAQRLPLDDRGRGLDDREIGATIASGLRFGLGHSRSST